MAPSLAACLLAAGERAVAEDSLPGWPAYLNVVHAAFSPPAAGDIDGDGDLEILANVGIPLFGDDVVEGIWAFHHDGVEVIDGDLNPATKGVFRALNFSPNFLRTPVTLGDLDDDPALEIVCLAPHTVLALNGDGSPVPGWPVDYPGAEEIDEFNAAPIMIADLDADGSNEVIFTTGEVEGLPNTFALHAFDAAGQRKPGWPVLLSRSDFGATVYVNLIGDLVDEPDKPGHLEIVASPHPTAAGAHDITAINSAGQVLWEYPFAALDVVGADLDGDGMIEVIAVEVPRIENDAIVTSVVALDGSGQLTKRHGLTIGRHIHEARMVGLDFNIRQSIGFVGAHPINEINPDVLMIGRVDGDAFPDVVLSTRFLHQTLQNLHGEFDTFIHEHRGWIHAIDLENGASLPHFPIRFDYDQPGSPTVISPERLIDVDGDGLVEILGAEVPSNLEKRLFFWDGDGTELLADSLFATTPGDFIVELVLRRGILGDFDLDGRLDYGSALRRGELHLASFRASALSPLYQPQYGWTSYRFDVQRTGVWRP